MNRLVSIGLAIAVAPAILLGIAQLIGASDLATVSSEALFVLALPLGGLLVLLGIVRRPAKAGWDKVAPVVGDAALAAAQAEAPPPLPAETTWMLIVRALRRIPALLLAVVLLGLAFFLPTGMEPVARVRSPRDVSPTLEQIDESIKIAEAVGARWADAGLGVIALVTLLFAARAGRWMPELRSWAHTVPAWIALCAGSMLIALALESYLRLGLHMGLAGILYLAVGAAAAATAVAAALVLSVVLGNPRRISAFRNGARAFAWASTLYFLTAFRFFQ